MRRTTKQRTAVRARLSQNTDFCSAQQLHQAMFSTGDSIGLATVYRNLQLMADEGEVDTIRNEDGEVLYRMCSDQLHHHHIVCRKCGRTDSIPAESVEQWVTSVADKFNYIEVEHTVDIFGICADCVAARND